MLHSVLWKDKDLCNLPELSHPLKACQPAFCRSQEVVIPSSLSLCWDSESVILSALLCACWYALAYRVRLCFGPVICLSHHKRNMQCGILYSSRENTDQYKASEVIPPSWIIKLTPEWCLFCCDVAETLIIRRTLMFRFKLFKISPKKHTHTHARLFQFKSVHGQTQKQTSGVKSFISVNKPHENSRKMKNKNTSYGINENMNMWYHFF